jgi:hypothetical protein
MNHSFEIPGSAIFWNVQPPTLMWADAGDTMGPHRSRTTTAANNGSDDEEMRTLGKMRNVFVSHDKRIFERNENPWTSLATFPPEFVEKSPNIIRWILYSDSASKPGIPNGKVGEQSGMIRRTFAQRLNSLVSPQGVQTSKVGWILEIFIAMLILLSCAQISLETLPRFHHVSVPDLFVSILLPSRIIDFLFFLVKLNGPCTVYKRLRSLPPCAGRADR